MGFNVKNRLEVSEQLEILNELVNSGEKLFNDDLDIDKYKRWKDDCEITLDKSIGDRYFLAKFKEGGMIHASSLLDKEALIKLLSFDINCLKSFHGNIARKKVGIWRARYLDLKNFCSEMWEHGKIALSAKVLVVIGIIGSWGLNSITKYIHKLFF